MPCHQSGAPFFFFIYKIRKTNGPREFFQWYIHLSLHFYKYQNSKKKEVLKWPSYHTHPTNAQSPLPGSTIISCSYSSRQHPPDSRHFTMDEQWCWVHWPRSKARTGSHVQPPPSLWLCYAFHGESKLTFLGRMPEVPSSPLRIYWNIRITTLETEVSPNHFRTWLETWKPRKRSNREFFPFFNEREKN